MVSPEGAEEVRRMARTRAVPHLVELGLHSGADIELAFLQELAWVRKLSGLALFADAFSHPPLLEWLAAIDRLRGLRTVRILRSGPEWRITIERDGKGRLAALLVETTAVWFSNLLASVASVVDRETRVEILVSPAPRPGHVKAVRALGARVPRVSLGSTVLARERGPTSSATRWGWIERPGRTRAC